MLDTLPSLEFRRDWDVDEHAVSANINFNGGAQECPPYIKVLDQLPKQRSTFSQSQSAEAAFL
jgi:hypothetical protein